MYVHIFGYLVNKLEIWWVYLSPIENLFVNIGHDVWLYNVEIPIRLCLFYIYRLCIGGRV